LTPVDIVALVLPILALLDWLAVFAFLRRIRAERLTHERAAQFQAGFMVGATVLATLAAVLGVNHFVAFLPSGAPTVLIAAVVLGVTAPQLAWWALSFRGRFR
jgi:hypothetical protein